MKELIKNYFRLIFDLWRYITEFWLAFWRETYKGTKEHYRGLLAFLSLCFLGLIILMAIGYEVSESPRFCGICHNMEAYVASWKASTHNFVRCAQCHYEPSFWNHLKGKWRDGQVSLVLFVTGKRSPKPHAEISDAACLQAGCHQAEKLKREMIFKNVAFDHGRHLEELRRGKKLRCTTCHSQIVQGAHITVTETDCFICHFYKAGARGEQRSLSSATCGSCHIQPKGNLVVEGVKFNHRKYIERGVPCLECHRGINKGDGAVLENKCIECHVEPDLVRTKYPSEFIHRKHVTDHKVECYRCHSQIKHEISGQPVMTEFAGSCERCHASNVHFGPREMYAGTGGFGVSREPSTMFLTGIDCVGCHRSELESEEALFTTRYTERALIRSCANCHGEGTEKMIVSWRKILVDLGNDLNRGVFEVQEELYGTKHEPSRREIVRRAEKLLNEARHNFSFVLVGKGVHNIEYAIKLLNYARKNTEEALGLLREGYEPEEFETRYTCTSLCHGGIEDRSVPFGKTVFPHLPHLEDMDCMDCHSPRKQHGETFFRNCDMCHHSMEIGRVDCVDCHQRTGNLFYGKMAVGVDDMPSFKATIIECDDCHRGLLEGGELGFRQVKARCIECHDESYGDILSTWKKTADDLIRGLEPRLTKIETVVQDLERKGKHTFIYTVPLGEVRYNFDFLKEGGGVHNLEYAQAVAEMAHRKLDKIEELIARGR